MRKTQYQRPAPPTFAYPFTQGDELGCGSFRLDVLRYSPSKTGIPTLTVLSKSITVVAQRQKHVKPNGSNARSPTNSRLRGEKNRSSHTEIFREIPTPYLAGTINYNWVSYGLRSVKRSCNPVKQTNVIHCRAAR